MTDGSVCPTLVCLGGAGGSAGRWIFPPEIAGRDIEAKRRQQRNSTANHPGGSGTVSLRQILLAKRSVQSQCDEELPRRGRFRGSPKASVACPPGATRSRAAADGEGVPRTLSDHDEFLLGVGRNGAQRILSPLLQNQGNRLSKVRQAVFTRSALAVCAGHLGAVRNTPWAVLLDDRGELVTHASILPLSAGLKAAGVAGNASSRRSPVFIENDGRYGAGWHPVRRLPHRKTQDAVSQTEFCA